MPNINSNEKPHDQSAYRKLVIQLPCFFVIHGSLVLYNFVYQPEFSFLIHLAVIIYLLIIGGMMITISTRAKSARLVYLFMFFLLSFFLSTATAPVAEFLLLRYSKIIDPMQTRTIHHASSRGNSYDDLIVYYNVAGIEYKRFFPHYESVANKTLKIRYSISLPRISKIEHVPISGTSPRN